MHSTVLLADDSVVVQKIVGLAFAKRDMKLVVAQGGSDVLEKALEVRPDLVLAATTLPATSGYDLCQAIKQELPRTSFVLLASPGEAIDRARALQVGSDDALRKPFDTQNLNDCVDRLLGPFAARRRPGSGPAAADPLARRPEPLGADSRVERLGPDPATAAPRKPPGPNRRENAAMAGDASGDREPPTGPVLRSELPPGSADPSPACDVPTAGDIPSQAVRDDLHRALEAVARDAFGDLCEAIVADVVDRMEKIAWEVIPAMTETLLAETIATAPNADGETGGDAPRKA